MGYKKGLLVLGVMLFLFLNLVNAESTINKVGEDIQMQINIEPSLKIIKQTGDEQLLDFSWNKIQDTEYQIQICHKDFSKNKNKFKAQYQIKTVKVKNKPPKDKTVNMKNNQCQTVDLDFDIGEIIKFGEDSTEIIFDENNVTIVVSPELRICNDVLCWADITFSNNGFSNISFNTSDLKIELSDGTFFLADGVRDWSQTELIVLEPEQEVTVQLNAKMDYGGLFKYNLSFFYINQTYILDPFFNTTNSTPPTADVTYPNGEMFLPNTTINLSGDAIDYYNISSVVFEIEKPNGVKSNFSANTQPTYYSMIHEPETDGIVDSYAGFGGDFGATYVTSVRFLMKGAIDTNFNRIQSEFNFNVNDGLEGWNHDLYICPTNVTTLTNNLNWSIDCSDTPFLIGYNSSLDPIFMGEFPHTFQLTKLSNNYTIKSGTNYIISAVYVSGFINDGETDYSTVFSDFNTPTSISFGVSLSNNTTAFFLSHIMNFKLHSDYIYSYIDTSSQGRYNITMFSTDFHNNVNISKSFFEICQPNYICSGYTLCNTSDFQTCNAVTDTNNCSAFNYTGDYSEFPPQSCNYCSEDIEPILGTCTYTNGTWTQTVDYQDNNYFSCCAITGLVSDCSVDYYPYNETTQDFCTVFNNTMDCDTATFEEYGYFEDRVEWLCYPPINQSSCVSFVKDTHGGIIQTNPFYEAQTSSLIKLDSDYEDRTTFSADNGIVSVYFTKRNLVFDGREYIYGVRCSDGANSYLYQELADPEYKSVKEPITRWFWFKENTTAIIFFMLLAFIIIIIAGFYLRELRRR